MSAHHDRGYGDLDLFLSVFSQRHKMTLVALELILRAHPPMSRALVFSDSFDSPFDKVMAIGVWGNRTRPLLPPAA